MCRLKCGAGYRLVGAESSICSDSRLGGTEWKPPLGRCESEFDAFALLEQASNPFIAEISLFITFFHFLFYYSLHSEISCRGFEEVPNGSMVCSNGARFRSVCYVLCDRGFRVNGTTFSTRCQGNGEWSNRVQTCHRELLSQFLIQIMNQIIASFFRPDITRYFQTQFFKSIDRRDLRPELSLGRVRIENGVRQKQFRIKVEVLLP